ncbi:hypothetical protein C474_20336 [Halogeometricum pallidum JCM 14848]|uniref:Uncharacterized protein n=1 Tax=Halogeometricum pallidum JCM 14848 TaxID=1227487 RepID=M0CSA0_HALPD|nr:hypothetical protein [Halogeometricum pallidum]ELZ26086.1 hypothetical protein C474_20336 [Halogeometricum pallidum JCM 14848]
MSRKPSDDSHRNRSSPSLVAPRVYRRAPCDAPPLTVQVGFLGVVVAGVVVLSYPAAAAAAAVTAAVVGLLVTAAGRAVRRAAVRETTVRVPLAGVELTVARSGE